jgi:hypothetical protein
MAEPKSAALPLGDAPTAASGRHHRHPEQTAQLAHRDDGYLGRSGRQHGRHHPPVGVGGLDDREPKFYAMPQPALPAKDYQGRAITCQPPDNSSPSGARRRILASQQHCAAAAIEAIRMQTPQYRKSALAKTALDFHSTSR